VIRPHGSGWTTDGDALPNPAATLLRGGGSRGAVRRETLGGLAGRGVGPAAAHTAQLGRIEHGFERQLAVMADDRDVLRPPERAL
jgi:hypothetical protein